MDYFMSILLLVLIMMHSVSCLWLYIGLKLENSWITHPTSGLNVVYGDQINN
jgi:hypothetical protein